MMSMHVQIGDCTTPKPHANNFVLLIYISLLYWPRQNKLQEMDREWWNNAAWTASAQKVARMKRRIHIWQCDGTAVMPPKGPSQCEITVDLEGKMES
jgi:hypothetical protein